MNQPGGKVNTFVAVWLAELLSLTGTAMTGFALGVWVYRETGSATQFATVVLVLYLPQVLVTPVSGMLADRYSRRTLMLAANAAAVMVTATLAAVVLAGALAVAVVYVATLLIAVCSAVQYPAFASSVAQLVPKRHLGRANGMVQMANASSRMLAPALAAALLPLVDILGVVLIDLASFAFMVGTLVLVRIPQPTATVATGGASIRRVLGDLGEGWRFITGDPGLLRLLGFFAIANVAAGFTLALLPPMVLDFASTAVLGLVLSAEGLGWLLGAILMIAWGGPRRRVHGVLIAGIVFGLGITLLGVRAVVPVIAVAVFVYAVCLPVINACNAAIWQVKVPPEIQGRAFGTLRMVALASVPVSAIVAGVLSDQVFRPLMAPEGALAGSVGALIGVGAGRGDALILIIIGLLPVIAGIAAYFSRPVREVEAQSPAAVAEPAVGTTARFGRNG